MSIFFKLFLIRYIHTPSPVRSSREASRVPPVAIKSSMTRIRFPGFIAVLEMQSSSPPNNKMISAAYQKIKT